ncbi:MULTISPECIES: hypothetical protein [unclassified Bradyrhizobium]|nr:MULTISPECIES: hypothetical protein [unclassified Bradyrhizobium]
MKARQIALWVLSVVALGALIGALCSAIFAPHACQPDIIGAVIKLGDCR